MPFYYDLFREVTTNASADTLSSHFRLLSIANQLPVRLVGLYGNAREGTAGGGDLSIVTAGTAGSGGTAQTPAKRNPRAPAAEVTAFNDATAITAGATPTERISVGIAQTGGMGGWVALEADHAPLLKPNGGADGNAEVSSRADAVSQKVRATLELSEG